MPPTSKPSLDSLGRDLLRVTPFQRWRSLMLPFLLVTLFFLFAESGYWPLSIACAVYLSFVTYGSTSHDLVHATLGLSPRASHRWLSLIELIMLRSGTAYRLSHLNHHASYPDREHDIEARAAYLPLGRTLVEGVILQPRLIGWAMRHGSPDDQKRIIGETLALLTILAIAVGAGWPTLSAYCALVIAGSWIIPFVTSWFVHVPQADHELFQTRVFRGRIYSWIALEHLYHLEHHLYPSVPHFQWPQLAKRLDPYFSEAGIKPVVLWF